MKIVVIAIITWLATMCANICLGQKQHNVPQISQQDGHGNFVTDSFTSTVLNENKIHLNPLRKIYVYLPASYKSSKRSYPVVFYFHTIVTNPSQLLESSGIKDLLDKAFSSNLCREFILVVPDCSSPVTGSFYENSSTSGRWLGYITQELVPFIDAKYRSIPQKESRAVIGDFMGGRGAFVLAMTRPDLFSMVYALHPVATGMGNIPWVNMDINWEKIHTATSFEELAGLGFTSIFLAIQQAFLPNPDRPPFYCDFMFEPENGHMKLNAENMQKVKDSFLLDHYLQKNRQNLLQLKAIAFDWGRFDPIQDHVISAEHLSRELQDLGINHEAEEYAGLPWNKNWSETGRFYTRVIPFLNRHLKFDGN